MTINGPGANQVSVSGNDSNRVFEVDTGLNVTINGLTITDGYAPDEAGGILNDGSNLTLSGDHLSQNVAYESATDGGRGGALRSLGGALTISDCEITGNRALGAAGTSAFGDALGGGLYVLAGSATISNSTISDNLAQGGDNSNDGAGLAGGILTAAPTSITGCTISDNLARGGADAPDNGAYGGGVYILPSSGSTITGCTFRGNQAVGGNGGTGQFVGIADGGALLPYGLTSISGSTFDHNQAIGGSDGNSGPGQSDPVMDSGFGGAISTGFGGVDVTSSSFSHNMAIGGNNATAVCHRHRPGRKCELGVLLTIALEMRPPLSDSTFDHNQAIGGQGNTGSGPVVYRRHRPGRRHRVEPRRRRDWAGHRQHRQQQPGPQQGHSAGTTTAVSPAWRAWSGPASVQASWNIWEAWPSVSGCELGHGQAIWRLPQHGLRQRGRLRRSRSRRRHLQLPGE